MDEQAKTTIERLELFKEKLAESERSLTPALRTYLNMHKQWVRQQVLEAGCFVTVTISPPPAVGGLLMQNIDPFTMMFHPPYGRDLRPTIRDMLEQTIGVLVNPPPERVDTIPVVEEAIRKGYLFVAMPMDPDDHDLVDVLEAIKEASTRCGLEAERIDEPVSSERITDRILESIRKAEFVVVDLTKSRPNVFYEAGFALGMGKLPIYVARHGTKLEFDLKDYPVIFFRSLKDLKDQLEKRLRGIAEQAQE